METINILNTTAIDGDGEEFHYGIKALAEFGLEKIVKTIKCYESDKSEQNAMIEFFKGHDVPAYVGDCSDVAFSTCEIYNILENGAE